ncbi:hypothetical protein RhiirB3_532363 [Rhizophagus irregularis]|nr:hypothetical protein RhiirB3_532363 [Rhizophagus irregularis]
MSIDGTRITLWCFVQGSSSIFKVKIGTNNDIDDLKKAIKSKKPNDTAGVDADKLSDISEEMLNDDNELEDERNATVVYDNYNETDPIVFEGEKGAFTSYSISIKTYLQNKDVWYIVDGKEPKNVNAKTILICSSRREHYKHFDEYSGTVAIRYMPTWSWKEIKSCRQVLYEDRVTPELAKDLYSKWGGIPRYVLERANDVTHQAKLNEAIKGSKGDIFDDIGESCIERSKFSHMIVHINVNHPVENDNKDENGKIPYTIVTIKFASDYVKEQVTDQLEERIRERLLEQTKQA